MISRLAASHMHDVYLIRHTTPDVAKGICYGQTDLGVTGSFEEEAAIIGEYLSACAVGAVFSSPLRRCSMLANRLFPDVPLHLRADLMEINCGEWEMKTWDELPKAVIEPWMADFVNIRIPGGESYIDLHTRVNSCWEEIMAAAGAFGDRGSVGSPGDHRSADGSRGSAASRPGSPVAVVAHGGVIRSILAGLTGTPLIDSFKVFALHYGCVIRIQPSAGGLIHSVLSNRAPAEKEQHKPSSFYK